MKFETPLIEGILIKRYKRFLADVKIKETGQIHVVHVPNSGSMLGVNTPGSACLISKSTNLNRKLPYTLEMVQTQSGAWVGVNTLKTNSLVKEAFEQKLISQWKKFDQIQSEVKLNDKTRIDYVLKSKNKKRWVEVKNVSMGEPPWATFPDAVTQRGQKHLKELMSLVKKGHEPEIIFVVQREDCHKFKPCDAIDPEYGKLLRKAQKAGVKINCWACQMSENEIKLIKKIPVRLCK